MRTRTALTAILEVPSAPPLPPEETTLDLRTVRLPPWLMPALHDLMEAAERALAGSSIGSKKAWVCASLLHVITLREFDDGPSRFAPPEFRPALIHILIESQWGLQFRHRGKPNRVLAEALAKLKGGGSLLAAAREQGFVSP